MFLRSLLRPEFRMPATVLLLLIAGAVLPSPLGDSIWAVGTLLGVGKILWDSAGKVRRGEFSLDYIAFLAMVVALASQEYLAGAVVSLMITGGESLDEYASARAESALKALADRIPKSCTVRLPDGTTTDRPIQDVQENDIIIVRANELIPLDGTLRSKEALLNEANLTGEAIPKLFRDGTFIKSGNVNVGTTLELSVRGGFETSTYKRIVSLVEEAKSHQAPVVRLAARVNFPFTALTLALSGGALLFSNDISRALAVLVIATPCPLLIAAPVAFIGGLSRAAHRNIIVKRPGTLEELTRAGIIFFDKTGTLTLGEPRLIRIDMKTPNYSEENILEAAVALEFHSIHPLAKAILTAGTDRGAKIKEAHNVTETIGKGISGTVDGTRYTVTKAIGTHESGIALSVLVDDEEIGRLYFEDELKKDVPALFKSLAAEGIEVQMLTGDKKENAERLFGGFGIPIRSEQTPESKYAIIDEKKRAGLVVAMVGDGLNDAPALAEANVGIVFSGTENSAAIEAADAVILGRDVSLILELFETSRRSMRIASQSIWGGVALSAIGMMFAAAGFIPPVQGAVIQEIIDITVILNSLRAARR